jgi:hypothetical protein
MSDPSIIEALAAEHIRELHVAASRRVLAAFARCCRQPSVNGIRKLTHFRHLKTDPPGLVMRPL